MDEPAAMPPMKVGLLSGAPSSYSLPTPMEVRPARPELRILMPELVVDDQQPLAPRPIPDPAPAPPQLAFSGPAASADAAGAPVLRRSNGREADCLPRTWLMQMSQAISFSLQYPGQSRQLGEVGTAYVRVTVARNGRVLESPLLRSSGYRNLDFEASAVVRRIGRFAPLSPSDCVGFDIIVVDQPIRFGGG